MPSIKSRILIGLMRRRHWFRGRFRKEVMVDDIKAILDFRQRCEDGAKRFGKLAKGVCTRQETIAGISSEWLIPEGAVEKKMIFYVHGGGYVSGSCADHRAIVSKVAALTSLSCLLFEYRLAPEHAHPAAIEDSVNVYRAIIEKGYQPENILVMGESAGGGLALALLLALKDKKLPLPTAAVAISPWTDLSCSSASYQTRNKKSLAPLESWTVFSKHYAGGKDLKDPYLSPLFGDLRVLPPLFINAGEDDELFDDGRLFSEKAALAGVDITFRPGPGMIHCYPLLAPMFPEATSAMNEIVEFIQKQLK